jgi:hypothetical protein
MPNRSAAAMAEPPAPSIDLGTYQGLPVRGVGIEMPSAAGGLRDPMKVSPVLLQVGEHVFVTFELNPRKFRYDPIEEGDEVVGWNLVGILAVENATFVDEDLVRDQLDEMAERVEAMREAEALEKEKAKGIRRIGGAEHLSADHAEGRHSEGLVEGCPECQAEVDAEASEAVDGKTAAAGG